ncbi:MAG: DUF1223 domain-containing protein [Alphaproteobacteria bacterium]|nr:DUF1223 domain-containing protein [Alphaproteobacteria bacterium]
MPGVGRTARGGGALHQPGLFVLSAGRPPDHRDFRPRRSGDAVLSGGLLGLPRLAGHARLAGQQRRQRDYAAARGDRDVYTPQVVVNGQRHMVGSDRQALEAALASVPPLPVDVAILSENGVLTIRVSGDMPVAGGMATVLLAFVAAPVAVDIGRGENRGSEIVYTNVVRSLRAVGMWDGGALEFRLPMSDLKKMQAERCAVLVQMEDGGRPGRILGAAIR